MTRPCLFVSLALLLLGLCACGDDTAEPGTIELEVSAGNCPPCAGAELELIVARRVSDDFFQTYCIERTEQPTTGGQGGSLNIPGIDVSGGEPLYVGLRVSCPSDPDCFACTSLKKLTDFSPTVHHLSLSALDTCMPAEPLDTRGLLPCTEI